MRLLKRGLLFFLFVGLFYVISYAWRAFPILTGYGAKDLCSCVWLAGRQPDNVIANELGKFPLSLGSFSVDVKDSSASGSVFGLAGKKAIYRKGFGCTLVSEISEAEIRSQALHRIMKNAPVTDTVAWPVGDKVSQVMPSNVDFEKLTGTVDRAFTETEKEKLRRVRAVIVVYDGKIILEKYADGYNAHSLHHGWSMTKSITNALIGILVGKGKLVVDAGAPVDEWKNDTRAGISLNNLMQASSGLHWRENYGGPSEATNMLFKRADMGGYTASMSSEEEPGKKFRYSSGTVNLISKIIRQKTGDGDYYNFPYAELFNKIGMYHTTLEPDASGTFVGSSYSFATARDWARFGLLYLNDGVWNGERILPEGWVKYSATPGTAAPQGEYGALFWLNAGSSSDPNNRRYPDVAPDEFGADGYEGQNIFILPSKKLVIVRLSLEQGNYLDENRFVADIGGSINQSMNE